MKYLLLAFAALSILSCSNSSKTEGIINERASLPPSFQFSKLGLKVMATFIDKKKGTMSTLYANPTAIERQKADVGKVYGGEVFALITWQQQEDVNWFGANIPGELQSVELLSLPAENEENGSIGYTRYKGKNLVVDRDTLDRRERIAYMLSQKPSVMP